MQTEDVYKSGLRKNLNRFMRELTDDGKLDFEAVPYYNLKSEIARNDEKCTIMISEVLLETQSGCPDRKLILQLINDFFLCSSIFRHNLLNDPSEFLEIMVEINPIRNPLPGSKVYGKELKAEAISVIKNWEKKYAKEDARMKCLAVTLKKTKFVDYENLEKKLEEEKTRKVMMEDRKRVMLDRTLSVFKSKFKEIKEDVDRLSIELHTTMEMLVPSFTSHDADNIPSTSADKPLVSSSKVLEIIIPDLAPRIKVTFENDAIVETFLGAKLLLIHRVQTLRKIVKRLQALKGPGEGLAQKIINYRDGIKKLVLKADELKIQQKKKPDTKKKARFDDDFIDVEISIDDILMVQYAQKEVDEIQKEEEEKVANKKEVPKKKEIEKPKPKIKSVPFGLDLKYWGEERKDVQVPRNNADCHRFWRPADDESIAGTVHDSIYTQRQFAFVGEAPKIDRECLAKLPNGSLCKRMDLHKCPLHGIIIARDKEGNPINEDDRRKEIQRIEKRRMKKAEEYSKQIMKEYESKTKRKKKHDIETTSSEDVRNRLQKKLLDPKTIERVSADITATRRKRLEKNFSHQFSHL
ncbi:hypothetical protein CAEBREN_16979 [Caenorhabditis brenneri]|uniref:UV-stimulated scaffold protein A C-terminal domain-containing protein n=1 Tax=Caenorhabditis brenneri TaxID=135651 RepID=G0MTM8_CAEBE|nr:hypothetical protein CAEBREN_16979 [Caenorhabditis brenneri]